MAGYAYGDVDVEVVCITFFGLRFRVAVMFWWGNCMLTINRVKRLVAGSDLYECRTSSSCGGAAVRTVQSEG